MKKNRPAKLTCPYCSKTAVLRKASYVYGPDTPVDYLYVCAGYPDCDSYVGVHTGTTYPKGYLANSELRNKRICTHRIFDQIWKQGIMSKKDAYRWIQDIFSLSEKQAHIGFFSEYMCDLLQENCKKVLSNHHITIP